ncbi:MULTISPECIES: acyl-CoA dehydrogenase family protein [Streptomyces]|uniref:acyl-CoA dehydrogenase family protein n=1 Tax=Streptomyces TaxID=1883 RepID=UPI00163B686E|nr:MULTISPECIES: acyl-CoA dehydrogenase family protein [Streptomyces]MBC2879516.1 acyl-CoA/acyl-ACP dehydrogenase [Streptomyces sp. TYQ1024]UBI35006.1 acyl-CoA/acyl-ACP dehydrogenase [Streptomyces mobaraensis]UKW27606.1 acyl-CoA/acyl-ACP dehydrogenase [Streptomyces sp. TYQ1024]
MSISLSLNSELRPATTSGEQAVAAVAKLHDFLAEQARITDQEGRFARDSVEALAEAGVFAATVPVELGGLGVERLHDLTMITARIARADASVAVAYYMHIALAWYFARVVRFGADTEPGYLPRREWLEAIGERRMLLCSAVAERGADYWNLATTATASYNGWAVNGRKILASLSPAATHFYCRLKAERGDGAHLASAMIPADTPGVHVEDDWDGLGLRGSGSGSVVFSDCVVPEEALLVRGPWGKRDAGMLEGRAVSGMGLNGVYLGLAEAARDQALESLSRPASSRPRTTTSSSVRTAVAEMEIALTAARGTLATALQDFDSYLLLNKPQVVTDDMSRAMMKECQAVSLVVERAAVAVIDHAMRLTGGASYHARHPLARAYRDVRAAAFMPPYSPPEEAADFLAETSLTALGD